VETAETQLTLALIPLGGRLLVRSKTDWRYAVVARIADDKITLSVASPKGGSYRLRRVPESAISYDGRIPYLCCDSLDTWRENFSTYDVRW
jgi:hypothetical protein